MRLHHNLCVSEKEKLSKFKVENVMLKYGFKHVFTADVITALTLEAVSQ